jgi:hypothetical protein
MWTFVSHGVQEKSSSERDDQQRGVLVPGSVLMEGNRGVLVVNYQYQQRKQ